MPSLSTIRHSLTILIPRTPSQAAAHWICPNAQDLCAVGLKSRIMRLFWSVILIMPSGAALLDVPQIDLVYQSGRDCV